MGKPTELSSEYWCVNCTEQIEESELVIMRECSRDSCGSEFTGTERNCPDCNSPFTRFIEDHIHADCEEVVDELEGGTCNQCNEWTPVDGDDCECCGEPFIDERRDDEDKGNEDDDPHDDNDLETEAKQEAAINEAYEINRAQETALATPEAPPVTTQRPAETNLNAQRDFSLADVELAVTTQRALL